MSRPLDPSNASFQIVPKRTPREVAELLVGVSPELAEQPEPVSPVPQPEERRRRARR